MYKIKCCHIALVVAVYSFISLFLVSLCFCSFLLLLFLPGNTSGTGKFEKLVNDTTTASTVYCIIYCLFTGAIFIYCLFTRAILKGLTLRKNKCVYVLLCILGELSLKHFGLVG